MKVRIVLLALIVSFLIVATMPVQALEYEEKPNVTAYIVGSNYLDRGEQKTVYIAIYNPAERKKVDYFDQEEAAFFAGKEDMLFTAYNVEVRLEGNEYIEVKTPTQKIPALPPLQPVNLAFIVKVKDEAKAGKYELKLKVSFDIIDDLVYVDTFNPTWMPTQKQVKDEDEANATYTYEYEMLTEHYKLRYEHLSFEIPIEVYVEEKDVRLDIVNVNAENMVGKSKGKLVVEVKNVGEKTAKNAYLVLETPSGFKASALSLSQAQTMSAMPAMAVPGTQMANAPSMPMGMPAQVASMPSTTSQPAYYVGELRPNDVAKAIFYIRIDTKDEGNYTFKVKAVYLDEYGNIAESDPVPFGVYVSKAPDFEVKSVESKVFVNAKGDVVVTLVPEMDLKDVSVYLTTKPPLSVLSAEYYLGDVQAGKEYTAVFKVQASDEAKPVIYPAEIKLKYRSMDEYFYTDSKSIGIKINPKMKFEVYGTPKIAAGSEGIVTFTIKNVGNFTIREATARLTITDPFSSDDDTAYIGTLKPGESAEIKFKLSVDADATPKKYGLNLEVKYKDLEDEWAISEPTKAVIEVVPPKPPYGAIALIAILAIVAVGYYLRRRRK
ncbi:COG1361 S-layer family protein [Archaeoglobus profundus]|uniref:S-layer domain-like protein n=1 Tax=Archaeoglobus profundus (strain DSM 5631 / JCM 9629 / NBRC 100127 / Av18) TaxID=572546 RepID=D2RGV4_ARCPA|nr:COG1361 S-layer family protein [Archaeoglobus profundus]ADB57529.1 S-layer domain-like protein [Archaeoglobus profundus DSM 5631]